MTEKKKIEGKTAEKWFSLGYNAEEPEEKVEYYTKVLEINLGYFGAWYNKGLALLILERYREAIECYDKALEIDPKDADAWHQKGLALDMLNRCGEATKCYEAAWEAGIKDRFKLQNSENDE